MKPPLAYEELRDVIDLALWAGQLLMQDGSDSRRIEETVHKISTGLGCDWADVLVSPNVIILTTSSGIEFRTKVRRVVRIGVNLSALTAISKLTHRVMDGEMDRFEVRQALEEITHTPPHYNRWVVVVMVGLACAAFSQLFGGDFPVLVATFAAAAGAMFARQELHKRYFNPFFIVVVTAFVAGLIASLPSIFEWSDTPEIALASSVLLLVPGVPLINSAEDLMEGHILMGLARGVTGGIIAFGIAIGLLLAMRLMGVSGL